METSTGYSVVLLGWVAKYALESERKRLVLAGQQVRTYDEKSARSVESGRVSQLGEPFPPIQGNCSTLTLHCHSESRIKV